MNPSESIECSVVVTDANNGTATSSVIATVQNTLPVFDTNAEILPDTGVVVGSVLTCTATASDVNDGPLTVQYQWSTGTTGQTYTVNAQDVEVGD